MGVSAPLDARDAFLAIAQRPIPGLGRRIYLLSQTLYLRSSNFFAPEDAHEPHYERLKPPPL